ncbi:MAG: cryptochrome/photolyase family protein [Bdellovibrio sp.]|nr:cryptochrome/photolyase family protein [Bdellovibrio sp.]
MGNQLFDPKQWPAALKEKKTVFMREDRELCTYYKFHKHKIIFFLAAMRAFRDELTQHGHTVQYEELSNDGLTYEESLIKFIKKSKFKKIFIYETEDKFFEKRLEQILLKTKIEFEVIASPMFLTSRDQFKTYLGQYKKPFMKNFYEKQRKQLKILIDDEAKPIGGQWSFDDENRLPLPAKIVPPPLPKVILNKHITDVKKICEKNFADHPGKADEFWLPVQREDAMKWLNHFLKEKLASFGPYEDALASHSDFVYHSVLTPFLNTGLLTPSDVVKATLKTAQKQAIPLSSLEGFIRQIIGWREFIHGIYQNFSEKQDVGNFWQHKRKLSKIWYEGGSTVPQLERTLEKVFKYSYCHHIERLMVLGNLMLLLEVEPQAAHSWFMEMFVDSSDWVMGPNVYGMALFSDGGIFATKPYICGSNYWRKMSKEPAGEWCDGVDGLYWRFIDKHRVFFSKNPRLSMMVRSFDKISAERKDKIFKAANILQQQLTVAK